MAAAAATFRSTANAVRNGQLIRGCHTDDFLTADYPKIPIRAIQAARPGACIFVTPLQVKFAISVK